MGLLNAVVLPGRLRTRFSFSTIRDTDIVNGVKTVRSRRISLTFRKVIASTHT